MPMSDVQLLLLESDLCLHSLMEVEVAEEIAKQTKKRKRRERWIRQWLPRRPLHVE